MRPFSIHVSDDALADLNRRLDETRWPDMLTPEVPASGVSVAYMRELIVYWRHHFDWRAAERRLNALPQFQTDIDGDTIHFVHARGRGPNAIPLILTHGWPGSFLEAEKILPVLTREGFDVVVPSLPGYGFSSRPNTPGMNVFRIADRWARLMTELGYDRFGAQGGDWGASVTTALALRHADRLIGIHLNYVPGSYRPFIDASSPVTPTEQRFLESADAWYESEGGYSHIQRTRPQTLAFALNDSPAGLAAWIVEKFRDWSDCGGNVEQRFTRDELLTNVMLYWVTETFHSSARLYYETRARPLAFAADDRVRVPTAVFRLAKEAPFPPRTWVERGYDVTRWTEHPRGGHFAALEEPEALAADVRAFFHPLR